MSTIRESFPATCLQSRRKNLGWFVRPSSEFAHQHYRAGPLSRRVKDLENFANTSFTASGPHRHVTSSVVCSSQLSEILLRNLPLKIGLPARFFFLFVFNLHFHPPHFSIGASIPDATPLNAVKVKTKKISRFYTLVFARAFLKFLSRHSCCRTFCVPSHARTAKLP